MSFKQQSAANVSLKKTIQLKIFYKDGWNVEMQHKEIFRFYIEIHQQALLFNVL